MKYYVGIAVDGRVYLEVEAEDFQEARDKANDMLCEVNLGQLECIEWHTVNAEDENGKFVDY